MSRFLLPAVLLALITIATLGVAQSDSASLGDHVPGVRTNNPPQSPVKVYDNDDLSPKRASAPIADTSTANADPVNPCNAVAADQGSNSGASAEDSGEIKVGQSPVERQRAYAVWKDRISQQREQVDRLARELDDLRTNAPLSVSVLHIWPDDAKYKTTLEEKQKGLDQARAELDDLLEQARKAGVPSSFR